MADLGFRLSAMSVTANIGRSFHTNFLLNGLYDNIVVEDQALTEAEAMAQTKERQLAIIKPELEQAVTDAEEYLRTMQMQSFRHWWTMQRPFWQIQDVGTLQN
ncbi:MAG: hypothetical protein ACLT46_11340 [Hungatella sp.]